MKWLVAIAAALLLETGLVIALASIEPPPIDVTVGNAKPEQGIPVVFRKSAPAAVIDPAKQAPTKSGRATDARVASVKSVARLEPVSSVHAATPVEAEARVATNTQVAVTVLTERSMDGAPVDQTDNQGGGGDGTADGGGVAAVGTSDGDPTGDPRHQVDLSAYGAQVTARIATNQRVLPQMQRMRMHGTAIVTLQIARDGHLESMSIAQSAGHPLLDNEAKRMVEDSAPFPPLPEDYPNESASFSVPVNFRPLN